MQYIQEKNKQKTSLEYGNAAPNVEVPKCSKMLRHAEKIYDSQLKTRHFCEFLKNYMRI